MLNDSIGCRSIESSRQHVCTSRSAEAQMLENILSSQPLPDVSETAPLPGYPRPPYPTHAYGLARSQERSFGMEPAHSSQDMLASHLQSQLRGIAHPAAQLVVPGPNGTLLAHAPPDGVPMDVPDSLDAIVKGLEGGELSLLPETTSTGGPSSLVCADHF